MLALCDGNNFYCSCEMVMRPSLRGRPLIVLSNNDGCAIARSEEAKKVGVKMGQPYHEVWHLEREVGLLALSANFTLYGDMSERMMSVFATFAPRMEVYSIDEAFLDFAGVHGDLVAVGRELRERVLQWIGVPCGIGLGTTKTMAKLANHIAKSAERKPGSYPAELAQVCNLGGMCVADREALYASTSVEEVWGVGPRIGARLKAQGIVNVLQLATLDVPTLRRQFSVMLEKTVRELQGIPCIGLEDAPTARQQIMVSRSFGAPVTQGRDLASAVTSFASRAAEKLREQGDAAGAVTVFIGTSPFRKNDEQYGRDGGVRVV
jgi:DNA polymerase V